MSEDLRTVVKMAAPRSIAGIGAFRDRASLLAALHAEFNVAVPITSRCIEAGAVTLACLAPMRYLATAERGANLPSRLSQNLNGLAAITDQSDLWSIFILSGPDTREILARLAPVDLAVDMFKEGDLALTRAGHLDIRLCHVRSDTFEIAVTRSAENDLRYALEQAARTRIAG